MDSVQEEFGTIAGAHNGMVRRTGNGLKNDLFGILGDNRFHGQVTEMNYILIIISGFQFNVILGHGENGRLDREPGHVSHIQQGSGQNRSFGEDPHHIRSAVGNPQVERAKGPVAVRQKGLYIRAVCKRRFENETDEEKRFGQGKLHGRISKRACPVQCPESVHRFLQRSYDGTQIIVGIRSLHHDRFCKRLPVMGSGRIDATDPQGQVSGRVSFALVIQISGKRCFSRENIEAVILQNPADTVSGNDHLVLSVKGNVNRVMITIRIRLGKGRINDPEHKFNPLRSSGWFFGRFFRRSVF